MKGYHRGDTIKTYFQKVDSGELDLPELRKILEEKNIDKGEITIIMSSIDRKIIRSAEIKADRAIGKNLFYGGLILSLVGLIVTIGTYAGFISLGGSLLIAYGPIAGGLAITMVGKSKMNRF